MEKQIKYSDISLIGMELFRKNNDTFMRSRLSPIMGKLFCAANKEFGVKDFENEYYMKSGILHNKVFYIYSDQLAEKNPKKLYDVVNFNGEICIWFYSNNVINMIEKEPVDAIHNLYKVIINLFRKVTYDNYAHPMNHTFVDDENSIASIAMTIGLVDFLHDTYGALDLDTCRGELIKHPRLLTHYTDDSINDFIDDVLAKYDGKTFYDSREYLDSYMLLEKRYHPLKFINTHKVDSNEES